MSRVRLHEDGLPAPDPQQDIFDENGSLLPGLTFAGRNSEPSGNSMERSSTGRLRKPGQSLEDAIFAEKLREDSLRDLGWQIVRWIWADLYRRGVIRDRVLRAFARATS